MPKTKLLDFNGQKIFVGIDTHKKQWSVTVRTKELHLSTYSADPSAPKLAEHLRSRYPNALFYSVYEAGFCGFWIHRQLQQLDIHNIIVNPADVPSTNKEKDRKADPIDSAKLSRELCNGSLHGIYVPSEQQEGLRVLSRNLSQYGRRSSQIKNRLKALLDFSGASCPTDIHNHWSKAHLQALDTLQLHSEHSTNVLKQHLLELHHIRTQQLSLLRRIRALSKDNPIIELLRTVPGIGVVTAFALYAELVDIRRFRTIDHLMSFIGLVPSTCSSAQKETVRGITNRHCEHLRYLLIEAAWIAARKDPALTRRFSVLCGRMNKQRAIIRIAKNLVRRIRAVWLHNEAYALGTLEVTRTSTPAQAGAGIEV
jgi:transposase